MDAIKWVVMALVALVVFWFCWKKIRPMWDGLKARLFGRKGGVVSGTDQLIIPPDSLVAPIFVLVVGRNRKREEILRTVKTIADIFKKATHPFKLNVGAVLPGLRPSHEPGWRCRWLNLCVKKYMGDKMSSLQKNRLVDQHLRTLVLQNPLDFGGSDLGTLITKGIQNLWQEEPWIMITLPGVLFNRHWDVMARSELKRVQQHLSSSAMGLEENGYVITEAASTEEENSQPNQVQRKLSISAQELLRRRSAELPSYLSVSQWDAEHATPQFAVQRCQVLPSRPLRTCFLSLSCLLGPANTVKRLCWPHQLPDLDALQFYASLYFWWRGVTFFTPTHSLLHPHCPEFDRQVKYTLAKKDREAFTAKQLEEKEQRALTTLWSLMLNGRSDLSGTKTVREWCRMAGLEWDLTSSGFNGWQISSDQNKKPPAQLKVQQAALLGIPRLSEQEQVRLGDHAPYEHCQVISKYGGWQAIMKNSD